ncbi:hypothetical protein NMB32_06405 [Stenotrophomonas sp. CD2]|nr:hypothetical protein NMB32_06405 [Stenotrophomonas sp. CD2]
MNAKTIAIAIALIAGTAVVSSVQASESIKTLSTVQARPAADQLAQQAGNRPAASRPRPPWKCARAPTSWPSATATSPPRSPPRCRSPPGLGGSAPELEQRVALAAELEAQRYAATLAAAATNVANSVIVNLPALQVRPSAADLQARPPKPPRSCCARNRCRPAPCRACAVKAAVVAGTLRR